MSQKGISHRLNANITTITIILIAAIVYINYSFGKKVLVGKIEDGAINQSNLVISSISRITVGTEEIASNVAQQVLYYHQHNDLELLLQKVVETNQRLESIHVELIDYKNNRIGRFSSGNLWQLKIRPDSIGENQAIRNITGDFDLLKKGLWSKPYLSAINDNLLFISYKKAILYSGTNELAGVVTCVVSLNKLQQILSGIKFGESGYAFIIDKSGLFITHPQTEWMLNQNLFTKPSVVFGNEVEKIETDIRRNGRGAGIGVSPYLDNQKSWFYYAPLENSNWYVIIVIPEKQLFHEIDEVFQKLLWVSGLGILALFLINMFLFKRLLEPLARVTDAIQRFSSVPGKEKKSKDEIILLAESLEDWQAKYGVLMNEQTKTATEKLKFEKDLELAREIQQNIFPSGYPAFPEYPEIDLYAALKPAESIGGDLYDYYFIDQDHLLLAIGDVAGKGIPASLFMAIASTMIKNKAKVLSSKEIVAAINNELGDRNPNQYFLTLFIGVLDIRTGIMDYCNAAHNHPYILQSDGTVLVLPKSHGLPLGIYANKTYKNSTYKLNDGDLIVFFTDGIINARNEEGIHYGNERFEAQIHEKAGLSAKLVVTQILQEIASYEEGTSQSDDITLMAFRYQPKVKNQA